MLRGGSVSEVSKLAWRLGGETGLNHPEFGGGSHLLEVRSMSRRPKRPLFALELRKQAVPAWCARSRASNQGLGTGEREHLKALERESREFKRANELCGKASGPFAAAELNRFTK